VIPLRGTVLALGPHPDDVELGCGGLLARLKGCKKHIRVFSDCEKSIPEGFTTEDLIAECHEAAALLGASCEVLDFPVRDFPAQRQEILEALVGLNKELRPDVVLVPSSTDIHQDHRVIFEEAVRAFRTCTVLGYEVSWSNKAHRPSLFVALGREDVEVKLSALRCYQTQAIGRSYFKDDEMFVAPLRVRGLQIRQLYAEAFEVLLGVI